MYQNDIEKIFYQDSFSKKKVAKGIHNRASRRGNKGAVRTTVDYLKGQAKKDYMNNSEVRISNMYDDIKNIPSREEILSMDKEKAKNILLTIKDKFPMKEIANQWGVKSQNTAYITFYKVGAMTKDPVRSKQTSNARARLKMEGKGQLLASKNNSTIPEKTESIPGADNAIADFLKKLASEIDELKENKDEQGYNLTFCGLFNKEVIENKLMNILTTLDSENEYELTFKLKEIPKK